MCIQLSITPRRKKGVMLLLRSAMRQPRNGNLNQPIRMHHAYGVDALLNIRLIKASHTECFITIIPCYVISKKFPRLLAEREIIANAFCLPTMSWKRHEPNPTVKLQRIV